MSHENCSLARRRLLKWIGASGTAGLAGCFEGTTNSGNSSGSGGNSDQILLTTAGGSPGGTGYSIMNALLSGASAEYPNLSYNIQPGGWTGNNTRLQNQELDLGHTTLAAGTLAYNLESPYDQEGWEQPPSNIRSVLADQSELFFFVVAQPDFEFDSLQAAAEANYPISVTNQPEGTFGGFLWDQVLNELNYGAEQIQNAGGSYRRVGWNDAAQLFSDNQVDAILAVGGRDLGWLNSIAANQDVKYLNWQDEFRTQINENYGVLKAELDGVFPNQDGTLRCMQDSGLVNTHTGVSEEGIYKVTSGIINREEQIRSSTGLLEPFATTESMTNPCPFQLHSGAIRAYEEAGIPVPNGNGGSDSNDSNTADGN